MIRLSTLALLLLAFASLAAAPRAERVVTSFDPGWKFVQADAPGAEAVAFDDAAWRAVDVPHDWSIEGTMAQDAATKRGGGFMPSGISWYRKSFTLPAGQSALRHIVEFDGVMANGEFWINGQPLGKRPYGYAPFTLDLTGKLNFGDKPNILAVRTDTTDQPASRWYTGQGIFRHVKLIATDPVHIDQWGTFITTPRIDAQGAVVRVKTKVVNQSDAPRATTLKITFYGPDGKAVGSAEGTETIPAGTSPEIEQEINIVSPKLWGIKEPNLYKAVSELSAGGKVFDNETNAFGIRTAEWKADTGFWLNGENMKLMGVCLHHDGGAVGSAVPLDVWRRRLEILRSAGVNAIRNSHNPQAAEFYDLCDRMGFLVMDETFDTWTARKPNGDFGYNVLFNEWWDEDQRDIVLRGRNHPSIIVWSAGNEIRDPLNREDGKARWLAQRDLFHQLDPTRPVTFALFRPTTMGVYENGFAETMDLVGQNYAEGQLIAAWEQNKERKIIGTETNHSRQAWLAMRDNAFFSGQFIWTGLMYLGEADWPMVGWPDALLDRTGGFTPLGRQRQSWWSKEPMVHAYRAVETSTLDSRGRPQRGRALLEDWSTSDATTSGTANVEVYSNCEEVELTLNGKSLGAKPKPADDAPRTWAVPFEAGTLVAQGKNGGAVVATHELKTSGPAAKLGLKADRESIGLTFDDVSQIVVEATDKDGAIAATAAAPVTFKVDGPGKLIAADNGDPVSKEGYQGPNRSLYRGRALAIVRATGPGEIRVTASAPGMEPATATIKAAQN